MDPFLWNSFDETVEKCFYSKICKTESQWIFQFTIYFFLQFNQTLFDLNKSDPIFSIDQLRMICLNRLNLNIEIWNKKKNIYRKQLQHFPRWWCHLRCSNVSKYPIGNDTLFKRFQVASMVWYRAVVLVRASRIWRSNSSNFLWFADVPRLFFFSLKSKESLFQ